MQRRAKQCRYLLSFLTSLVSEREWLCSMVYRQKHQVGHLVRCAHHPGDPLKPVREHERCFHREWSNVLHEIASACPLVTESCAALLALDPLVTESDAGIKHHVGQIHSVLSDAKLASKMLRERKRKALARVLVSLRKGKGWSRPKLASECERAAKQRGFRLGAPDVWRLMDYEAGRSLPSDGTMRLLASAFGLNVAQLQAPPFPSLKLPSHQHLASNLPLPCAPAYRTGIFMTIDELDSVPPQRTFNDLDR